MAHPGVAANRALAVFMFATLRFRRWASRHFRHQVWAAEHALIRPGGSVPAPGQASPLRGGNPRQAGSIADVLCLAKFTVSETVVVCVKAGLVLLPVIVNV